MARIKPIHDAVSLSRGLRQVALNSLPRPEMSVGELFQNARDAIVLSGKKDGKIYFDFIKNADNTFDLTVKENGIGMKYDPNEDLTRARKTGDIKLLQSPSSTSKADAEDLAGTYGVGFYTVGMLTKKVAVYSRREGHEATIMMLLDLDKFYDGKLSNMNKLDQAKNILDNYDYMQLGFESRDPLNGGTGTVIVLKGIPMDLQVDVYDFIKRLGQFSEIPVYLQGDKMEAILTPINSPLKNAVKITGRKGWISIVHNDDDTDLPRHSIGVNVIIKGVYQLTLGADAFSSSTKLRRLLEKMMIVAVVEANELEMVQSRSELSKTGNAGIKFRKFEESMEQAADKGLTKFFKNTKHIEDSENSLSILDFVEDFYLNHKVWAKPFLENYHLQRITRHGSTKVKLSTVITQGTIKFTEREGLSKAKFLVHNNDEVIYYLGDKEKRMLMYIREALGIKLINVREITVESIQGVPIKNPRYKKLKQDMRKLLEDYTEFLHTKDVKIKVGNVLEHGKPTSSVQAYFQKRVDRPDIVFFNKSFLENHIHFGTYNRIRKDERYKLLRNIVPTFAHELTHREHIGGMSFDMEESKMRSLLNIGLTNMIRDFQEDQKISEKNKKIENLKAKLSDKIKELTKARNEAKQAVRLYSKSRFIDLSKPIGIKRLNESNKAIVSFKKGKDYFIVNKTEVPTLLKNHKNLKELKDVPYHKRGYVALDSGQKLKLTYRRRR